MQTNRQDLFTELTSRHDPAEGWGRSQPSHWLSRSHVTIIALGAPIAPDDQLVWLQSAVARFVGLLFGTRIPNFGIRRLARPTALLRQLF